MNERGMLDEIDDDDVLNAAVVAESQARGIPPMVDFLSNDELLKWWDRLSTDPSPTSDRWVEYAFSRLEKFVKDVGLLRRERDEMLRKLRDG